MSWDRCYRFSIHFGNLKLGRIQEHFLCWPHGQIPSFNWALIEADYMAVRGRSGSKNIRLIVSSPLDGLGNTDMSYSHLSQVRCHGKSKPYGIETGVCIKVFQKWNTAFPVLLDKIWEFSPFDIFQDASSIGFGAIDLSTSFKNIFHFKGVFSLSSCSFHHVWCTELGVE